MTNSVRELVEAARAAIEHDERDMTTMPQRYLRRMRFAIAAVEAEGGGWIEIPPAPTVSGKEPK